VAGDEWDYVILSTVRSLPEYEIDPRPSPGWCSANMGFICDPHQINVALTRARMGLIIVGDYKPFYVMFCHGTDDDRVGQLHKGSNASSIPLAEAGVSGCFVFPSVL